MNPRTSSLEFALLGLLRQKPQSGYDLRKMFGSTPMRHFSDSPGSIYPALQRLEARKWVAAEREQENSRKRRSLRVTAAGKRSLIRWLLEPVTRRDVISGMDGLLLRFAFFDGNLDRKLACKFLTDLERELQGYLSDLDHYSAASGLRNAKSTGGLAFLNGVEGYRANLSWVRRARKKLAKRQR